MAAIDMSQMNNDSQTAMAAAMAKAANDRKVAEQSAADGERAIALNALKKKLKRTPTQAEIDAEVMRRRRSAAAKKGAATRRENAAAKQAEADAAKAAEERQQQEARNAEMRAQQEKVRLQGEATAKGMSPEALVRRLEVSAIDASVLRAELKQALRDDVADDVLIEACERCVVKAEQMGWPVFNSGIKAESYWAQRIEAVGYAGDFSFLEAAQPVWYHLAHQHPKPKGINWVQSATDLNARLHDTEVQADDAKLAKLLADITALINHPRCRWGKFRVNAPQGVDPIYAGSKQAERISGFDKGDILSFRQAPKPVQQTAEAAVAKQPVKQKLTPEVVQTLLQISKEVAAAANDFAGNGKVDISRSHEWSPLMKVVKRFGLTAANYSWKQLPIHGIEPESDAAKAIKHCFGKISGNGQEAARALANILVFRMPSDE